MSTEQRTRTITNAAKVGTRFDFRCAMMTADRHLDKIHNLHAGESCSIRVSDYLIIMTDRNSNFELNIGNGLQLNPVQVNNDHPRFPGQTLAVYQVKEKNDDEFAMRSGGDVDVHPPKNPFP